MNIITMSCGTPFGMLRQASWWRRERLPCVPAKLGYKNAVSFSAAVCHWFKDGKKHLKYIYQREYILRSEVDSLIPPAPHRHKKASPCANTDKPKG